MTKADVHPVAVGGDFTRSGFITFMVKYKGGWFVGNAQSMMTRETKIQMI
jgi:hypothetical protein